MQNNWNHWRMEPADVKRRVIQAKVHLDFCTEVYMFQLSKGRHFLHEHPATATSWQDEEILRLGSLPGVGSVVGHMCQYGMTHKGKDGVERPVLKPTRWLSSRPALLARLERKCPNGCNTRFGHKHTVLFGKEKTQAAAVYPPELCRQILLGIQDQLKREAAAMGPYLGNQPEGRPRDST